MGRRRRRKQSADGVELNMAAMLDMAFQLLAFFILTFKPAILEETIALKLPIPGQIKAPQPGGKPPDPNQAPITVFETMTVTLGSDPAGKLSSFTLDQNLNCTSLQDLSAKMAVRLREAGEGGIEQVIIEVPPQLLLQELMKVFDVCLAQKMKDGTPLRTVSPVLAKGGAAKA